MPSPACNLVGPDLEIGQVGAAIYRRERAVYCVLPAGDFDPADAGHIEPRIRREPGSSQIHLRVGMEVHVLLGRGEADVRQVAGHIARWEIECSIERDGEVCEIAANPIAALQDVPCRQIGPTGHIAVFDVLMNPAADGLDSRPAMLDMSELVPGEIGELVGIAIPAGERIAQQRGRKVPNGLRYAWNEAEVIGFRRDGDDGVVPETVCARLQRYPTNAVPMAVLELFGRKIVAQRQSLEEHRTARIRGQLEIEEERSRACDFIGQTTTHAHGDVEVQQIVVGFHARAGDYTGRHWKQ